VLNVVQQTPDKIKLKLPKMGKFLGEMRLFSWVGIHRHDTTKYYKTDPT
jgi:hypothetical protein